jgi:hypothetical protein
VSLNPHSLADCLGCIVYRTERGNMGIRAVRPVRSGARCITAGEHLALENGQSFSLCHEEGTILQKYELQLYV